MIGFMIRRDPSVAARSCVTSGRLLEGRILGRVVMHGSIMRAFPSVKHDCCNADAMLTVCRSGHAGNKTLFVGNEDLAYSTWNVTT